jgi:serine/threonine protein kinase/tetratricopeptide (TPR) repeat protein
MTAVCPSEATILAFLDGTIAPGQRADVEVHLASCPVCGEVAAWVAADLASPSRTPGREGRPFIGGLAAGTTVGRYQVLGAIGRGGMGEVYAAYHPDLDRRIALKVVSASGVGGAERWSRLLREARTLARLSHPNVINVYDAGPLGDGVYIAMEFVEGQTLHKWLRAAPRAWRAILDVFAAAGAGLTAAHAAQIVHRDFKPQNVMIGNDGRVRVTDFGLARTAAEPDAPAPDGVAATSSPPTVTATGSLLGTPAYMAPEQLRGEPADARSDQFSFCVTLHEALFGSRPPQPTLGKSSALPGKGTGVPAWVRAAVQRGLAPDREQRHPSMSHLLAALARGRSHLRRRLAITAAVALVLLIPLAGWRLGAGRIACAVPEERVGAAWSGAPRRDAVHRAFTTIAAAAGETSWQRVSAVLDAYVGEWRTAYVATCEATNVHGEQSAEVLDLRMSCLRDGLDEVHALVDTISAPSDRTAVFQAVTAAKNLTPVSRCANVPLLRSDIPLPRDEKTLEEVLRLRRRLLEVRELREVGSLHGAHTKAQALRRDVEAAGYRPLLGKALTLLGMIQSDLGLAAERTLEEAVFAAESARDDLTVATASAALVYMVGYRLDRMDDAERWARLSAAALDRVVKSHESERVRSWLLHDRSIALYSHRKFEPALALMREAIALKEQTAGQDHPDTALSIASLGGFLTYMGKSDEALPVLDRAIEIIRRNGGPDTPWLDDMMSTKGDALLRLRRFETAAAAFTEALTIQNKAPTVNHDCRFQVLSGLGRAEIGMGTLPRARAHLEQALELAKNAPVIWSTTAEAQLALAQLLWTSEADRTRAVSLVRSAQHAYATHDANFLDQKDDVDLWLATHVLPSKQARRPRAP